MREQFYDEMEEVMRQVGHLMGSLMRESERATVVLAAARLDVDLESLLKHLLHRQPGGADALFDSDRALGSFSAKIAMAHRLGAISADFEHALQLLRRIRNDFAHGLESETLASPRQKQRLAELVRWAHGDAVYQSQMAVLKQEEGKTLEHVQFVACVVRMFVLITRGLRTLRRVDVGSPLG